MSQEDKKLLIEDLCCRLQFNLICQYDRILPKGYETNHPEISGILYSIKKEDDVFYFNISGTLCQIADFKPFLRSISKMTEDECKKLFEILSIDTNSETDWIKINDIGVLRLFTETGKDFNEIANAISYLNEHMIDYRFLIDKGLALEASEGMYNF